MRLPLKQLGQDGATQGQVVTWNDTTGKYEPGDSNLAGGLSVSNRDMVASITTADGQLATATTLAATITAWVEVQVNGAGVEMGDGVKTKACYMSGDSGATARAYGALTAGDQLYWNGSIAGYELSATDRIDVIYDNEGAGGSGGGGGGVDTMGAFGSTPNANGGSIAGTTLTLQPADATNPGGVTTGAQTFAGVKTFSAGIALNSQAITGVAAGVSATDAANVSQLLGSSGSFVSEVTVSDATSRLTDAALAGLNPSRVVFTTLLTTDVTLDDDAITGPVIEVSYANGYEVHIQSSLGPSYTGNLTIYSDDDTTHFSGVVLTTASIVIKPGDHLHLMANYEAPSPARCLWREVYRVIA
jgi:hypothetical protein